MSGVVVAVVAAVIAVRATNGSGGAEASGAKSAENRSTTGFSSPNPAKPRKSPPLEFDQQSIETILAIGSSDGRLSSFQKKVVDRLTSENWRTVYAALQARAAQGVLLEDEWKAFVDAASRVAPKELLDSLIGDGKRNLCAAPMRELTKMRPDQALDWIQNNRVGDPGITKEYIRVIAESDLDSAGNMFVQHPFLLSYDGFSTYIDQMIIQKGLNSSIEDIYRMVETDSPITKKNPKGAVCNMLSSKLILQAKSSQDYSALTQFANAHVNSPNVDDHTIQEIALALKPVAPDEAYKIVEQRLGQQTEKPNEKLTALKNSLQAKPAP